MPIIIVGQHAYKTITTTSLVPFEKEGHQRPNGEWEVFVSEDYVARIKHKMLSNESIGEAIERWFPQRAAG